MVAVSRWIPLVALLAACGGADGAPSDSPGWMASIADERALTELSIPGTHESASLHEPIPGAGQCQRLTLAEQLEAGVRYFDIRCRHLDNMFGIFHGPLDEQQTFDDVLATMSTFLDAHPTETVIMSIKEEGAADSTALTFEQVYASYVAKAPDRWYLGDAVPALGDVRGQIVLLRRFTALASPLGIDASAWADDTTFTLDDPHAMLRVQDAYQVSANDAKWDAITALLTEARDAPLDTLFLNYTSGYQLRSGLPNVPSVSTDIDTRLVDYLQDPANAHARTGVLAMDFVDSLQVRAVIALDTP